MDAVSQYDNIWTEKWGDLQRYGPTSRHTRRIITQLLASIMFDSVLDVGCGEGSLLHWLGHAFPRRSYSGFDISPEALELARLKTPSAKFYDGSLEDLVSKTQFDLVTCIDVVEHIEDDLEMIRTLAAASRRYVLCMSVQGRMRPGEREIGHVRNYLPGELRGKMEQAGLRIVREVQWGFPFFSPIFRSFVSTTKSEELSYGRYGLHQKLICNALYGLFLLNSWSRGDKVFVLGVKA